LFNVDYALLYKSREKLAMKKPPQCGGWDGSLKVNISCLNRNNMKKDYQLNILAIVCGV
jgi:hypothetical protein